jgi:iron(III) transport system substrate-binding protein
MGGAKGRVEVRSRRRGWLAGLLVTALVAVACGDDDAEDEATPESNAPQVYAELARLNRPLSPDLIERAQREGELDVYTSNPDLEEISSEFEDAYDVDVNIYRANSETVIQRLLQEEEAGYHGSDVVETNVLELETLARRRLLAPYDGEVREGIREEGLFDRWTATRFNVFVVAWNTGLIPKGEEPRSWADLADPSSRTSTGT